jgi:hypothetical protein
MCQWCNEERQALETQLRELANADAQMQIEQWKQQHEQKLDWTLYNAMLAMITRVARFWQRKAHISTGTA